MLEDKTNTWVKCSCYEKELAERRWRAFGVNPKDVKSINEYIPYDETTRKAKMKAESYLKNFDKICSDRENSFGLFGQPGAGKTHLIVAIGAALLNREPNPVTVVYMPYLEAIKELKANALDHEYYIRIVSKYQEAKLLIIDDLFKDKIKKGEVVGELTETDIKHIYPIINYRYINKLPTLISTECTPDMLLELDEALAGRILETCGDNMVIFSGPKYNFRMRKFKK
nr:DnaA/Hda family protein [Caloramator australicus]